MRASTAQTAADDVLPVLSPASNPSWVLLNGVGAQLDVAGDRVTTSAMSRMANGEEISVSLELVEPPGISVLTFATLTKSSGNVLAAHRDVVLLAITISFFPFPCFVDLFVYQASHDPSRRSSLLLLPDRKTGTKAIGIMSCTTNDDDLPSFVVAQLRMTTQGTGNVRVFRSGSGQWESFKNLHVRGTNGSHHLRWWSADVVVPYGRRHMIWADYYRGMVIMELSWKSDSEMTNSPPRLRYVPLPVDRTGVLWYPEDNNGFRGYPKACRSVCVTRYGIKLVRIDTMLVEWCRRFRVTTWSLREDNYSWKKDLTMHEEEFLEAFYGGDRFPLPHVMPDYPIVDPGNPDVVVFQLNPGFCHCDEPKWLIQVDLRNKVLLAATAYSGKEGDVLSGDAKAINSARVSYYDPIQSE